MVVPFSNDSLIEKRRAKEKHDEETRRIVESMICAFLAVLAAGSFVAVAVNFVITTITILLK